MTGDGIHSYSYDAEGNILTVDNGGTATYIYDAMNRRVSVQAGSATHEYAFDYAGRRVSSWLLNQSGYPQGLGDEGRIYWDGRQIAYRAEDGTTYFDHQDYLGTERVRTNSAGASVATFTTLPWGDGGTTTFGGNGAVQDNSDFAGLDFDQASGTDHAQFRNYSPAQGRWLAPEPYDGSYDLTNPQSFNRYAYALNNPTSFTDPSGLNDSDCGNNPNCGAQGAGGGGGGNSGCSVDDASCGGCDPPWPDCVAPQPYFPPIPPIDWGSDPGSFGETGGLPTGLPPVGGGLGGIFGLPSGPGCEFGACGAGPGSFQNPGAVIAAPLTFCQQYPALCSAVWIGISSIPRVVPIVALGTATIILQGDNKASPAGVDAIKCYEQYDRDLDTCRQNGKRSCYSQAAERYAACLAGKTLPPFNF
jgi:RHS repeat-associated protein